MRINVKNYIYNLFKIFRILQSQKLRLSKNPHHHIHTHGNGMFRCYCMIVLIKHYSFLSKYFAKI